MSDYSALIISKSTNRAVMSIGHYDMAKLEAEINSCMSGMTNCYALYNEDAREFSWCRAYDDLSEVSRWMIDVAIPELPAIEDRMKHRVDKLVAVARSRIIKAGFSVTCSRCGGSGHFSYNQVDGTLCYGCSGRKSAMVKLTKANKKLITEHFAAEQG